MTEDWQTGGFGLYIHWPFCEAKCPYCDFNSHVARKIDQKRWLRAYISELDRAVKETQGRILNAVFFGGGTPSLMDPEVVADLIEHIRKLWPVANDLEITLEANPSSVEAGRFAAYAQGGINRVSMGIQALNDEDLQRLGRIHSAAEARQAFDIARQNFARVSFDLIYARQNQSVDAWKQELQDAINMSVDHLSLYQLTIEPGTAFADRLARGGLRGLPSDDASVDMFEATQEICAEAGMPAYEVSNHAAIGSESRHNLIYWRYGDYVGIGPGAHGRLTFNGKKHATVGWLQPDKWLSEAEAGSGEKSREALTREESSDEYLMMGLRISEGIHLDRYERLSGKEIPTDKLEQLSDNGLIIIDNSRIRATTHGRLLLNAVIRELLVV